MKRLLLLAAFVAVWGITFAQSKTIKNFYEKYKGLEEVTDLKLQGWMIRLAARSTEDVEEQKLLKKITHLRILSMENGNLVSPQEHSQLVQSVKKEAFESLLQIRDQGQHVEFFIREKGNIITDLLLLISGVEQFVLISLEGNLDFSDLQHLHIDTTGGEHFRKIPKEKKQIPRA